MSIDNEEDFQIRLDQLRQYYAWMHQDHEHQIATILYLKIGLLAAGLYGCFVTIILIGMFFYK